MSFTIFNSFQRTAAYSVARPVPPTITTAAFGTLTALGQIPLTNIVYNSVTSYYNLLVNGTTVATNQTASSYNYSGGLANNTQYGPFTVVPYTAAGVAGTAFTVTGGSGAGRIYTWAYAGTLSFTGTSSSGTTLNFTGQSLSSVYITYTPTSGVTPVSGTKTSTLPVAFSGMTSSTTYTYTVYPVNGDNVPGSASGTNTATGSVTTTPPTVWVAAGAGTNTLAYSTNGVAWTGITGTTIFSANGWRAGYDPSNNLWVAAGTGTNGLAYSKNAINWTGLGNNTTFSNGTCAAYGNGIWLATGAVPPGNSIAYSTNGTIWTGLVGGTNIFGTGGQTVAYDPSNNLWVGGGYGGSCLGYSKDGVTWTGLTGKTIFSTQGMGVAYSSVQKLWVAIGQGTAHTLAYSSNGTAWTGLGVTTFTGQAAGVAYGNNMWVAAGPGTLAYSTNGTTWIGIGASVFSTGARGVSYSSVQDLWVAVGWAAGGNTIAYSKNGTNWTGLGKTVMNGTLTYGVSVSS